MVPLFRDVVPASFVQSPLLITSAELLMLIPLLVMNWAETAGLKHKSKTHPMEVIKNFFIRSGD
jgi:hypothetical protein